LIIALTIPVLAGAFVPSTSRLSSSRSVFHRSTRDVSLIHVSTGIDDNTQNGIYQNPFVIPREDVHPIFSPKGKVVNAFGVMVALVSLVTGPIWMAAMKTLQMVNKVFKSFDPNRAIYDYTGKIWSRVFLWLSMSYPTLTGNVQYLKEHNGPCLFVANHASWLDIPVLCTVLDPVFKFIAKGELGNVPCIGDQLRGGNHILIDREDRRSQLRTFKEGCGWLNKGVPLMAFPEGRRSADGRLMDFKGGEFSMAVRCNVPIIPITISNTHAIMPSYSLFPIQSGAGKLSVHIHPPINIDGRKEAELSELVREAIVSKLPIDQRPAPPPEEIVSIALEDDEVIKESEKANVSA